MYLPLLSCQILELCEIIPVVASVSFRQYLFGKFAILYDFFCKICDYQHLIGPACQEGGFYCPDSASSLYYEGSASLNGGINLRVCA